MLFDDIFLRRNCEIISLGKEGETYTNKEPGPQLCSRSVTNVFLIARIMLHVTMQYNDSTLVQYNTIQYSTIQYNT